MYLIQQTRNRKETLVPLRGRMEDLKIEIVDVNTMGEYTLIETGCEEVVNVVTSGDDDASEDGMASTPRPRKRAKLDHLSAEQKAQHRKMMNRISAQSARDRQRALMQQQEVSLNKLTETLEQLKEENRLLKKKNEVLLGENQSIKTLTTENEKLQARVADLENQLKCQKPRDEHNEVSSSMRLETSCSSSEPAVPSVVPLPKGLELQLFLICTLLIWEHCSNGISTLQKSCKLWSNFQNKFSVKTQSLEVLNKLSPQALQTLMVGYNNNLKNHLPEPPD